MHEVVAAATSLAGAGAVALPAPSTDPAPTELGAVPAYRSTGFATGTATATATGTATGTGTAGGVRAVS